MTHGRTNGASTGKQSPLLARLAARKEDDMSSREGQVLAILDRMLANVGRGVLGAAVVASDGLVLASRLTDSGQIDYLGAIAATIYGVTERAVHEFKTGHVDETIIKANTGLLMVLPIADLGILVLDLDQGANLGMARLEARAAVVSLRTVLAATVLERTIG